MKPQAPAVLITAVAAAVGCGNSSPPPAASPKAQSVRPADTTCRQLQTRAAARRLALKIDYLLIVPEHESRRHVVGTRAGSLYATCRQPKLPGVADPLDYKPVKPVVAQIQTDYDEEEIAGG